MMEKEQTMYDIIRGIVSLVYIGLYALSLIWYFKYNIDCSTCNIMMLNMHALFICGAKTADNLQAAFRCAALASLGANAIWLSAIDPIVGAVPILLMLWHYLRKSVKNGALNATIGWLIFLTMVTIVIVVWVNN
ncbi:MAG: hypothetical protein IJW75_05315 [Alphaproteobacteria bacterium]|nr:hypothetical protein [Alphaproteobacteria bacterium]